MADWDGTGLPPVAEQRVERFRSSPLRTSLLGVPSAAALSDVGFDTVGEVMGTIVQRIGFQGWAGCGLYGPTLYGYGGQTRASGSSRFAGYGPYVRAVTHGYETARARMLLEASALGADGVVGVTLRVGDVGGATEFVALGTAVRSRGRTRPARPFTTDLSGPEVATMLRAGWVPASLQVAVEVAIRHDDWATRQQAGSRLFNTQNVEVSGYTDLVQHTRSFARDKIARQLRDLGADGGILSSMRLRVWSIEPGENHRDHVAEVVVIGNAVARFGRGRHETPSTLTVLPVGGRTHIRYRSGR